MADSHSALALTDAQSLANFFTSKFPNYKIIPRGKKVVVVGTGAAKGVGVIIRGPDKFRMNWQFPSLGAQMVLVLSIVLTGILPGLIAFLIVWLVVKDDVNRIKQEVTAALAQG